MSEMTPRERVLAALEGQEVDRPPVSLWRHFPEEDQTAEALASSTLQWQQMLDLDFIKLMPPGDYATIDWGAKSEFQGAPGGTRETIHYPIAGPDDWLKIEPVSANKGFNAHVVDACRLVREGVGPDVPVLQTIFSPLTIANKLSNGLVIDHLRSDPEKVHQALAVIRDVTVEMTKESLSAGADGVFFASQCATSDLVSQEEYDEFGVAYDEPVLAAAREAGSIFTMIHIHGANTYFDLMAGYDGHAINWHDRRVGPPIAEVLRDYPARAAVGGIDEKGIADMTPEQVREQVLDARRQAGDRRLLIGPGCVALVATPEENLKAAVQAARQALTTEQ
ncbi:MAG TPA: uroporphyrinogen decarboxylase family protein [Thermomicrobiales bacterium]|nr:uroporphyrinogen decarboxylase family protein [Thermomicrobiales bacterium]